MIEFRQVESECIHDGCSQDDGYTQNKIHLVAGIQISRPRMTCEWCRTHHGIPLADPFIKYTIASYHQRTGSVPVECIIRESCHVGQ